MSIIVQFRLKKIGCATLPPPSPKHGISTPLRPFSCALLVRRSLTTWTRRRNAIRRTPRSPAAPASGGTFPSCDRPLAVECDRKTVAGRAAHAIPAAQHAAPRTWQRSPACPHSSAHGLTASPSFAVLILRLFVTESLELLHPTVEHSGAVRQRLAATCEPVRRPHPSKSSCWASCCATARAAMRFLGRQALKVQAAATLPAAAFFSFSSWRTCDLWVRKARAVSDRWCVRHSNSWRPSSNVCTM